MRRWPRSIGAAFAFLTRIPIPGAGGAGELGRSVVWFPLVGAALGAILLGAARALDGQLSAGVLAVALVALLALLSGGLHLDGLADTFDAWGGGRGDRARMLEIMRDSRIGAHGAAALALLLAGKIFAVLALLSRGTLWPLLAAPAVARWAVVPLVVLFRYARPNGLGSPFQQRRRAIDVLGATLLAAPLGFWFGVAALRAGALALAAALLLAIAIGRRLGGLTGDVYGAAIEMAELVFWATVC
ncbi:MAG TPA: adenosylcobinamide-GDP ribazoletransferase [Polyangia bacterium]|nr:adenosylcobinamide-GDP ribazoletransferase [Polyangia bacterium]